MSRLGANLPHRWLVGLAAALLLLGGLSLLARDTSPGDDTGPALQIDSNRPRGARALLLWLREVGYEPNTLAFRAFEIAPGTDALFVFRPTYTFSDSDIEHIATWVERGGVLFIVDDRGNALLSHFDASISQRGSRPASATPLQPILSAPAVHEVSTTGVSVADLADPAWIPVLGIDGSTQRPILALRPWGDGWVYVLADTFPVSNAGIADADNAALVLNILAGIPPGGVITFDAYHQGLTEHGTLSARFVREPWGWAIIYASAIVFLYLAFSGMRFGRATPVAPIQMLRTRAEYVGTMGGMLRRGQHHDWLRQQYAVQVKRAVGTRYGVRADQPASEFITALLAHRPDADDLGPVLERLEYGGNLDEGTVVALMREAGTIQQRLTGER
jgi:hypothetical protein